MNILYIIDSLRPGGAERQLVELIKALSKSNKFKLALGLLEGAESGYSEIISGLNIEVHHFLRRSRLDFTPIFTIHRLILRNSVDLVHGFLNLGALFATIAAKLSFRPSVCSSIRSARDKYLKSMINIKIESCIADILVSNSVAGFKNRFKAMQPNFRVIYNGMDFERFKVPFEDVDAAKEKFNLRRFEKIIGMVASFSDFKDYNCVVRAADIVLKKWPGAGFLFIGDGPNLDSVKTLTVDMHLKDNFIFTGYQADTETFYPLMDLFVLMTRADLILEGISNSLLEAMASGVPVIASSGGGTDELISYGETGILVPPRDHVALAREIISLLKDPDRRSSMSRKAKVDVQGRFSIDRYVQDHIAVYQELSSREFK